MDFCEKEMGWKFVDTFSGKMLANDEQGEELTKFGESRKPWINNGIGYIPLTKGKTAMVDADDLPRLSYGIWFAMGTTNGRFYAARDTKVSGKHRTTMMHHAVIGRKKGMYVDHRNGNSMDNRKCNLRFCTASQNLINVGVRKGKSSRFKGVHWNGYSWVARISYNRTRHNLGAFVDEVDAAIVYNVAAQLCYGEFAVLNPV
jgi:hypothetical protein